MELPVNLEEIRYLMDKKLYSEFQRVITEMWDGQIVKVDRGKNVIIPVIKPSIYTSDSTGSLDFAIDSPKVETMNIELETFVSQIRIKENSFVEKNQILNIFNHVADKLISKAVGCVNGAILYSHFKNEFSPENKRIIALNNVIHIVPRSDHQSLDISLVTSLGARTLKNDPKIEALEKLYCEGCSERLLCNLNRADAINKGEAKCLNPKK